MDKVENTIVKKNSLPSFVTFLESDCFKSSFELPIEGKKKTRL